MLSFGERPIKSRQSGSSIEVARQLSQFTVYLRAGSWTNFSIERIGHTAAGAGDRRRFDWITHEIDFHVETDPYPTVAGRIA
jgi:hypothetical protein